MTRTSASPWLAALLAAGALLGAPARADPPPLRVDYQAAEGCPAEEVFVDEIRRRTRLARLAAPGEEALAVRARIARRGAVSDGRLVLGAGKDRVVREIQSERCEEVVSAFALIAALAIDPRALSAPLPAAPPVFPAPPPLPPPPAGALPPPRVSAWTGPAQILADPLPVPPSIAPAPAPLRTWTIGAHVAAAFAVTPRTLIGGAIFAERAFAGRAAVSLRLDVELAGTGSFDVGPAGASFLRGEARVEGCAFAVRPLPRVSLVPCLGAEGGVLHGQGLPSASLPRVQEASVPWLGAGVLPRASLDLGALAIEAQGGPMFPLVRRTFAFDGPAYVIYTLPAVTWTTYLGAGFHFP